MAALPDFPQFDYNNRIFYEYCVKSDPMCDYRFKQPRSSLTCDYCLYASVYTGLDTVEVLMFVIYYAPRHYDILIKLLKASTKRFIAISMATSTGTASYKGRSRQATHRVLSQK